MRSIVKKLIIQKPYKTNVTLMPFVRFLRHRNGNINIYMLHFCVLHTKRVC